MPLLWIYLVDIVCCGCFPSDFQLGRWHIWNSRKQTLLNFELIFCKLQSQDFVADCRKGFNMREIACLAFIKFYLWAEARQTFVLYMARCMCSWHLYVKMVWGCGMGWHFPKAARIAGLEQYLFVKQHVYVALCVPSTNLVKCLKSWSIMQFTLSLCSLCAYELDIILKRYSGFKLCCLVFILFNNFICGLFYCLLHSIVYAAF